ncbi:MAG: glycosyltransferase family 4 protein [Acidobacteria bacterium]|nr:glycosyltransferase family 4 protein [Acidobacteriota bacterium]
MQLMAALRVAVVADLLEERWPSMDLMAEMLMAHAGTNGSVVSANLLRPTFRTRTPGLLRGGAAGTPPTFERIAQRFWSYPRWIRQQPSADVYHIVDHSYAHLSHDLPAERVVVTCHDTDAFRTLISPAERESTLPHWLVRRVLSGLRAAGAVVCVSEVTRRELVGRDLVRMDRTRVVPIGVHPACSPATDHTADRSAATLTGDTGATDLLHVGSTIPRKRIDVLLETVARLAHTRPDVRLWRVGGAFTSAQATLARDLGIEHRITVMPFVSRPVLAALYRRAALVLLPSDREGFGLPVIEAMACGTPIVCSDLPVLREVGGTAAAYCAPGDPTAWAHRVATLLDERDSRADAWAARRSAGVAHSAAFSWKHYASAMESVYQEIAGVAVR